jgi:flagellar biosynthesis/type III secretory pathway protein FliH
MPFDFLGDAASIGDTASAFNAAELTGLDSFDAAFEAGITDANSFDFAQGPDGLLGSAIPGAGGDLGVEGWYNVDYDQTFIGSDSQAALFDGGASVDSDIYNGSTFEGGGGIDNPAAVDSNFVSDAGARDELVNADAAASVDSNTDLTTRGIRVADVGPSNVAPEPVFNPRDGTLATPLPTVGADPVDRLLTGASTGLNTGLNAVKAAGANAVSGLASSIQAEIPKIVAQAKQQVIGQAVGAATGLVKATVAKALPGPLAAVANNVVNSVGNNAAIALGATPVSGAVDLTGGGGGDTANLSPGQVAALGGGGGGEITAAGLIDTAATNIRNYGNQLYSDTARGVQSLVANSVSSVTATGQNAEASATAIAQLIADSNTAAAASDATAAAVAATASEAYNKTLLAQRQETLAQQRKIANNGDWRVRLTLHPDPTIYTMIQMHPSTVASYGHWHKVVG